MKKLLSILFLSMNIVDLQALPNQWSVHNCNYKEHDITWTIRDKHHDLHNTLSIGTVEAIYVMPEEPFSKAVSLVIGKHRPFLHHLGKIKAPASGDTLHIWWDLEAKEYRASYNQCGILVNTAHKTADAFSNVATSTAHAVKNTATNVVEKAKDSTHRMADNVKHAVSAGAEKAKDLGAKANKEIKETAHTVADKTKNAAQEISGKAKGAYNATKAKVHEITRDSNKTTIKPKDVIYVEDAQVTVVRK